VLALALRAESGLGLQPAVNLGLYQLGETLLQQAHVLPAVLNTGTQQLVRIVSVSVFGGEKFPRINLFQNMYETRTVLIKKKISGLSFVLILNQNEMDEF
jgi:hypothetical protein